MRPSRREFIKSALWTGTALSVPTIAGAQSKGGKKYKTALIGSGWWGLNITREAIASGECSIAAICDVDERQIAGALKTIEELSGEKPKVYKDYRELLEKEKPQIAIVATPDHWHALPMIAAVKAGADVYVEKPISHTIGEGLAMVQAARANDRVVQVGTHRRVSPHNISGMKFLKEGGAGKIGMVRAFVHYPGGPGQKTPNEEPPEELDWDFWCGPAPMVPYNPSIHPKGFRHFLDFANGTLGDWGIHWLDQILWWTEEKYPKTVYSTGGRPIRRDTPDAPDTQIVGYEFEDFTVSWEHRRYAGNGAEKHNIGCYFYGTKGTFHMGWRDGWNFYPTARGAQVLHEEPSLNKPDEQNIRELWADFLSCVKSRKKPVCDIEIGYHSTNMSLLGMLSLKLGRSINWDGANNRVIGDEEANKGLVREYRAPWEYPEFT